MLDTDTILKQILHSTILSLNGWSIYINCYKEINKQPSYWNKRFERTNVLLNRACLEWQLYPDTRNSRNILTKILILKIDPGSNILYWNVSQKIISNVNWIGYCWKNKVRLSICISWVYVWVCNSEKVLQDPGKDIKY